MTDDGAAGASGPVRAEQGDPALRVIRVDLTYDGTGFLGWQRQASGPTVQGVVEAALARLLGGPHPVVASGRTDAGVHARHLVASFRTAHPMPAATLARALDSLLPADVGVLGARDAPPDFHARKSAAWKWYRYSILRCRGKRPLWARTTWHRSGPLDPEALRAGAAVLEGRHDFAAFAAAGPLPGGSVRWVHRLRWTAEGEVLHLDAVGEGFLHHMVRNVVGTLVREAAPGGGGATAVAGILAGLDRRAAGPTAPAPGLTLMAVAVRGEPAPEWVPPDLRVAVESGAEPATGDTSCRS